MDFVNLLIEEWSYHLMNIGILVAFSLYGAYTSINKKIKLEVFRLFEKQNKKLTDKQKNTIKENQQKGLMKEFIKAFLGLFVLYSIYIVYRSGIFS